MSQLVCCPGDPQAWLSVTSASVSPVLLSLTSHLHTSSEEQVQTGWQKVLPSKPMHATQCPYVRFFPPRGTSWGPCLLCSISSPHPATQFPWACPLFCLLSVSSRQHGLVSLGTMCLCHRQQCPFILGTLALVHPGTPHKGCFVAFRDVSSLLCHIGAADPGSCP